jgi:hypothetical protein
VDDGVWRVIEGPPEIATAMNAAAGPAREGDHVDQQRLREARILYPGLEAWIDPRSRLPDAKMGD